MSAPPLRDPTLRALARRSATRYADEPPEVKRFWAASALEDEIASLRGGRRLARTERWLERVEQRRRRAALRRGRILLRLP